MKRLAPALAFARTHAAELLVTAALLVGWLLVALAVARLTKRGDVVWPAAIGLLCLSATGWRFLLTLARDGLYTLTQDKTDG